MKKYYTKPQFYSEQFVANEYISACWYGNCNLSGDVYLDSNDSRFYEEGIDQYSYRNSACTHQFSIQGVDNGYNEASDLINAFVVGKQQQWVQDGEYFWEGHFEEIVTVTPVYNFDKVHVSTIDSIQKAADRPNHS